MKYLILIFSLLFYNLFYSKVTQDSAIYEIKYNFSYLVDTTDITTLKNEPMLLLTNLKKSVYISENFKKKIDLAKNQFARLTSRVSEINLSALPSAKVKHTVFKDVDKIYISNYIERDLYTFEIKDKFIWKIDDKSKTKILEYNCQKATCRIGNKTFEAWFTTEIPITDGPYKFNGLPGLILKVREVNNYFIFEAISIKNSKSAIEFQKGIDVTLEQFIKKRNENIKNPNFNKALTIQERKAYENQLKKYNNSLE